MFLYQDTTIKSNVVPRSFLRLTRSSLIHLFVIVILLLFLDDEEENQTINLDEPDATREIMTGTQSDLHDNNATTTKDNNDTTHHVVIDTAQHDNDTMRYDENDTTHHAVIDTSQYDNVITRDELHEVFNMMPMTQRVDEMRM